jgi:hypothetical protein
MIKYLPYFAYPFLAFIAVCLKLISFTTGFITIAPAVKLNGELRYPWKWLFQPDDSSAIGDYREVMVNGKLEKTEVVFQDREGAFTKNYPTWLRNYILCIMWSCMRNPAYGFDSRVAGCPAELTNVQSEGPEVSWGYDENENAVYTLGKRKITAEANGYKYFNYIIAFRLCDYLPSWFPFFQERGFLTSIGWNLQGTVVNSKIRNLKIDIAGKSTVRNKI